MKTHLTGESTPVEILRTLSDYLPFISNITEILNDLEHLQLNETDIRKVLSGQSAYIFGEISSSKYQYRKVTVSFAKVEIMNDNGVPRVHIEGFPIDRFISQELERQRILENTTKEELLCEIHALKQTVKYGSERIRILENHIRTLRF